jgi:hypothetical protein
MALKYSRAVSNNRLNAIETQIGTDPFLKIYTGPIPANCNVAATGTLLANVALPSDWLAAASDTDDAVTKSKSGTWSDSSADGTGVAAYFRIYNNSQATAHIQGTANVTSFSPDMTLDSNNFTSGQTFTVNSFVITAGNFP